VGIVLKRENAEQARQLRGKDFASSERIASVPILEIERKYANAGEVHERAQPFGVKFEGFGVAASLPVEIGVKVTACIELDEVVVCSCAGQNFGERPGRQLAKRGHGQAPGERDSASFRVGIIKAPFVAASEIAHYPLDVVAIGQGEVDEVNAVTPIES